MKRQEIKKVKIGEIFTLARSDEFESFQKKLGQMTQTKEDMESMFFCDEHSITALNDTGVISNAILCKEWAKQKLYDVHKSKKDHQGNTIPNGSFVVFAKLPDGQISFYYPLEKWNLFKRVPTSRKAKFEHDGHTQEDVFKRLATL